MVTFLSTILPMVIKMYIIVICATTDFCQLCHKPHGFLVIISALGPVTPRLHLVAKASHGTDGIESIITCNRFFAIYQNIF